MLIKGAIVCDKRGERLADVRAEEGKIKKVAQDITPKKSELVIDAKGQYLMPGLVDIGASIGEGVQDIFKALKKLSDFAIRGGVTTVAVQPDTAINTEIGMDYFFSKSKEISLCALTPIVSATENNKCEKLNNLAIMHKNGASGAFLPSFADSNMLKRSMEYSKMFSSALFVSCFDPSLDKNAFMHDGEISFAMGLGGFSVVSESSEMAKVVDIASFVGSKLVVRSLSSQKSVEIAKDAKKNYDNIFFDLSLHHLVLTDSSCEGYNSYAKNFPPLREERDKKALLEAISSKTIDTVSSGHKPATRLAKDLSFEEASFAIESLGLMLPVLYSLVQQKYLSLSKVSALTSYNPAQILGLANKGLVKEGFDADLVIFDPYRKSPQPHECSPYEKVRLSGAVSYTIKDAEIKFVAD